MPPAQWLNPDGKLMTPEQVLTDPNLGSDHIDDYYNNLYSYLAKPENHNLALLTGTGGQDFLYEVSTFHWDDAGAQAGKLFEWIAAEATSPDPAVAARAGESAHALASFLGNRGDGLLGIKSGVFGLTRSTVGALNPNLVRAYGTALTPYQGAMVCDTRTVNGFGGLAEPCEAAVSAAKPVFAALNTDPGTASAFADAAYARMDRYLESFVESDPPRSIRNRPRPAT